METAVTFQYVDAEQCVPIHAFGVDFSHRLVVVGQVGDAAYEWILYRDAEVVDHSNAGYGCSLSALRDGLIYALGGDVPYCANGSGA